MRFVELVDRVRREGGVSGGKIETLQGDLREETARLKTWVQDAWRDIQTERTNWRFLFCEGEYVVPQYVSVVYPPEFEARQISDWQNFTVRIAPSGYGRHRSDLLIPQNYWVMRDTFPHRPHQFGKPSSYSIHPNTEALHISPASDREYELFYDYYRTPQELDDDNEEPIMPDRFHMLIVWMALERYGGYEVAQDVVSRAQMQSAKLMAALIEDQLPAMGTDTLESGCYWHGW